MSALARPEASGPETTEAFEQEALSAVRAALAGVGRLGVAFSGGVDSSVLLALAVRALGADRVVAILGVSPSLAADERAAAHQVAGMIGAPVVEVTTHEGDRAGIPGQRSGPVLPLQGRAVHPDRRRGRGARTGWTRSRTARTPTTRVRPGPPGRPGRDRPPGAAPAGRAPGWTRPRSAGIARALGPALRRQAGGALPGLPHPAPPAGHARRSCARSSRPRQALRALGFADLRVRHHGDVARIELPADDLLARGHRAAARPVVRAVRGAGFRFAAVDLGRHAVRRVHPAAGAHGQPWLSADRRSWPRSPSWISTGPRRRGYPEAVYCAGKTPEQVAADRGRRAAPARVVTLFTRADPEHAAAVLAELPGRLLRRRRRAAGLAGRAARQPAGGLVVVLAAGTSDLPVAREAQLTAALPRPADRARGRRRRRRAAPDPRPARAAAPGPGDRRGRRHGRRAAQRRGRAGQRTGGRGADLGRATAPRSRGWPPCWPCSTPARRAWPWSTSTTVTAPATSPPRSPAPAQRAR